MRKLFYAIGAAICLATSNLASAACANQNVYSSGVNVPTNGSATVYGPVAVGCYGGMLTFKFEDFSGNYPTSKIRHIIERYEQTYIGTYQWNIAYQTTTQSVRSFTIQYPVLTTGVYRYRIVNVGNTVIRNWGMEGKVPLYNIPSYY